MHTLTYTKYFKSHHFDSKNRSIRSISNSNTDEFQQPFDFNWLSFCIDFPLQIQKKKIFFKKKSGMNLVEINST
jgi:hypothetical protein